VTFINHVEGRVVALNACTQDWNPQSKTQGSCYPIDGFVGTGDIATMEPHTFMIDATGRTYASLQVVYYVDNNAYRLCYVDSSNLMKMHNDMQLELIWKDDPGDLPCGRQSI